MAWRENDMAGDVIQLRDLPRDKVPLDLRYETYFDFDAHPFAHRKLFDRDDAASVYGAILAIGDYAAGWLTEQTASRRSRAGTTAVTDATGSPKAQTVGHFEVILADGAVFAPAAVIGSSGNATRHAICIESGARVIGAVIYLADGDISVGSRTVIEPGVGIKGPTIIGADCEIRQGAYLRGNCIVGNGCIVRGELKNTVMMDRGNFPHPSYVGDSLLGYRTHFGNQATAANVGIYEGLRELDERKNLCIRVEGAAYDLGKPKMGICMGDFSQMGCNSVSDPGTFLRPYTIAYSLTRLRKGFYGPHEVLKNKPMEHGVIERTALKSLD